MLLQDVLAKEAATGRGAAIDAANVAAFAMSDVEQEGEIRFDDENVFLVQFPPFLVFCNLLTVVLTIGYRRILLLRWNVLPLLTAGWMVPLRHLHRPLFRSR